MPKVKLTPRSTADLSEAYKATDDFTKSLAARNTLDYTRETAKYELEGQRLFELEKQNIKDFETAYDQALLAEKQLGTTFDDNTRDTLRNAARDISNARTQAALGQGVYGEKYDGKGLTMGHSKAYETIAKNERTLDAMVANTGSLFELNNKIQASNGLKKGDIGKMIYNGSGNTANLVEIVKGVFDNSGDVKYEVGKAGEPYYVKNIKGKDVKVPVELITNIMTGENATYPIQFNEDPTESLKLIHENLAQTPEVFKTTETSESQRLSGGGRYITTTGGKKVYIDEKAYKEAFRNKSLALLQDTEQMQTFWEVLAVSGDYTEDPGYYKPDEVTTYMGKKMPMKEAAQYLAANYAANMFIVDDKGKGFDVTNASSTKVNTGYKPPTPVVPPPAADVEDFQKLQYQANSFFSKTQGPQAYADYLRSLPGNGTKYYTINEIEQQVLGGQIRMDDETKEEWLKTFRKGNAKGVYKDSYKNSIFEIDENGNPKVWLQNSNNRDAVMNRTYEAAGYDDAALSKLKQYSLNFTGVRHKMREGGSLDPSAPEITDPAKLSAGQKKKIQDFMDNRNKSRRWDKDIKKLTTLKDALAAWNKSVGEKGKVMAKKANLPGTK